MELSDYIIIYSYDDRCVPNIIVTTKEYADKVWDEYKQTRLIPHNDFSKLKHSTTIKPLALYICKIEKHSEKVNN